jgi:hypothetical protein
MGFINNLTSNQLNYISDYLEESSYIFYTKNYAILKYFYFAFNEFRDCIQNSFAFYGFTSFSKLYNIHIEKKNFKPITYEDITKKEWSNNMKSFFIMKEGYYSFGFEQSFFFNVLFIFKKCYDNMELEYFYNEDESLIVIGDIKKDICAFIESKGFFTS